jgi:hypothetical protein
VDERLRLAVDASVGWYDALCALHGVGCGVEDGLWVAYGAPPPLHSAAKTVEPGVDPGRAVGAVEGLSSTSVADSFGELDLAPHGFHLLIDARWLHAPPPPPRDLPSGWTVVRTADDLAAWTTHHDAAQVLLPGLLERSSFTVLAHRRADRMVAGAVTRLGTGVVDLSNVWSAPGHDLDRAELLTAVAALHPGRDVVGYEAGDDLTRALEAGFTDVGPQLVWAR